LNTLLEWPPIHDVAFPEHLHGCANPGPAPAAWMRHPLRQSVHIRVEKLDEPVWKVDALAELMYVAPEVLPWWG
jgi:hypothetical protein